MEHDNPMINMTTGTIGSQQSSMGPLVLLYSQLYISSWLKSPAKETVCVQYEGNSSKQWKSGNCGLEEECSQELQVGAAMEMPMERQRQCFDLAVYTQKCH